VFVILTKLIKKSNPHLKEPFTKSGRNKERKKRKREREKPEQSDISQLLFF
jgi:hypothetical protein